MLGCCTHIPSPLPHRGLGVAAGVDAAFLQEHGACKQPNRPSRHEIIPVGREARALREDFRRCQRGRAATGYGVESTFKRHRLPRTAGPGCIENVSPQRR